MKRVELLEAVANLQSKFNKDLDKIKSVSTKHTDGFKAIDKDFGPAKIQDTTKEYLDLITILGASGKKADVTRVRQLSRSFSKWLDFAQKGLIYLQK